MNNLFNIGDFTLHAGQSSTFLIDCSVLTDVDWAAVAAYMAPKLKPFSQIEGVPRGGLKFAEAMLPYRRNSGGLLIVDDVYTTGTSMEAHRNDRIAAGLVLFARGKLAHWVNAMWIFNNEKTN